MVAKAQKRTESEDGRVRRGARNNEAIVQAIYELISETHLPPTVDEVASRAGVARRTVFRQFEDLDGLYRTMGERVMQEAMARIVFVAPSKNLETDLAALVDRRSTLFEFITPFRRAARLVRHESPFIREQNERATVSLRGGLLAVVGSHLDGDAEDTVEALDLLLSFEAWERLRHEQKVSVRRAKKILAAAAHALVSAATKPELDQRRKRT